ncbi:hypothetical protein EUTSA_v10009644mg [Eutrema salsugineum]|uniref:F-box domain-containing protein n=1 Tax=Eutrema salsugineum TaxID=72664 RepID=V4MPI4_EUTSA|nr:hypothetical protein EUTSA_v10009644mg [Eutrema salsugineum]
MKAQRKRKKKKKKKKKGKKGSVSFSSYSLPLDLIIEILKRSPVKTLMRFLSVSKLWASIIRSRKFMKQHLNESLNRPRGLVFVFKSKHYGLTTHEASPSLASLASYLVTCPAIFSAPSVHGLICYGSHSTPGVYNLCTRRSITLPDLDSYSETYITQLYLGYDPIDSDYKVLCVMIETPESGNTRGLAMEIWVLTLGSENSWKMIQDNIPPHSPISQNVCINGVLYYQALTGEELENSAIMRFDVRSEKIDLIKAVKLDDLVNEPSNFRNFSKLISYEGKPAFIVFEKYYAYNIALCVLEDAAKEEWSMKTFVLPTLIHRSVDRFQRFRSTDTKTVRRVHIQDIPDEFYDAGDVYLVSSDQVENLMFL